MTGKRSPTSSRLGRPGQQKARRDLATAFTICLTSTDTSHPNAAKALGVAERTIGAWCRAETAITVEVILAAPRLAKAFKRELCGEHHDALPGYVATKRVRNHDR